MASRKFYLGGLALGMALVLCVGAFAEACSVQPPGVDSDYAKKLAESVRCARGYGGGCWCFVVCSDHRYPRGTGIALAPDKFCSGL